VCFSFPSFCPSPPANQQNVLFRGGFSRGVRFLQLHDLSRGEYLLEVLSTHLAFAPVRLSVEKARDGKPVMKAKYADEFAQLGGNYGARLAHPLKLQPYGVMDYFVQREGFNPMGMLMNPMVLMMVFTLGMSFCLPKMMEGVEDAQNEMAEQGEDGEEGGRVFNEEPTPSWQNFNLIAGGPSTQK
jgi:ER membrane protein complex subunit 7